MSFEPDKSPPAAPSDLTPDKIAAIASVLRDDAGQPWSADEVRRVIDTLDPDRALAFVRECLAAAGRAPSADAEPEREPPPADRPPGRSPTAVEPGVPSSLRGTEPRRSALQPLPAPL